MIFSILIAVIIALLLVVIIIALKNLKKTEDGQEVSQKIQKKGKSAILKEAEKKLFELGQTGLQEHSILNEYMPWIWKIEGMC